MNIHVGRILEKVSQISLGAIVFLIPIVAFPWTTDQLDFNKNFVFVVLATVGSLAYMGSMIAERRISFKAHWFFLLPVLILIMTAVSSSFSIAPYTSWLGESGAEYISFLSTLLLAIFLVVSSHLLSDRHLQRKVFSVFFVSSALLSVFVLIAFVQGATGISGGTIGLPSMLALYLLTATILGHALWLVEKNELEHHVLPEGGWGIVIRGAIVLTSMACFCLLIALQIPALWMLTIVGLTPIFVFALALPKEFSQPIRYVFPMLLLISALLYSLPFLPLPQLRDPYIPEVNAPFSLSWKVAVGTLKDGHLLLGSGPGTYADDFVKFVGTELNTANGGQFWDLRLNRGSSQLTTMLATHGILGTALFLLMMLAVVLLSVRALLRSRTHDGWKYLYGSFSAWLLLSVGWLFYFSQNFTFAVLYVFLTAMLLAEILPSAREFPFARSPRAALVSAFAFMLTGVGVLMVFFVSSSRYSAEIAFAKAVSRDREGADVTEVVTLLNQAATRNRWNDAYYRNLSNALLIQSSQLAQEKDADPKAVQAIIDMANRSGLQATSLGPNTVMNWELRGMLYRELSQAVPNANDLAIASYEQAIKLSPNNPKYLVGLARTFLVRADLLAPIVKGDDKDLAKKADDQRSAVLKTAKDTLAQALALKGDFVLAQYYMAFVDERLGSLADAVKDMEVVRATNPKDVGVSVQLSLLYLRQGKNDLAQAELERALTIAPTFANAHWYLSTIYADKGLIDKAIAELEEIKKTNPDDTAVQQQLEKLKSGNTVKTPEIPAPIDETVPPSETTAPTTITP
ncbi:MAG: tetratricopeptide repeat protein [Patescibacteria group bacterium]|jgi:tetratricopeptide (TPR) repeat protein